MMDGGSKKIKIVKKGRKDGTQLQRARTDSSNKNVKKTRNFSESLVLIWDFTFSASTKAWTALLTKASDLRGGQGQESWSLPTIPSLEIHLSDCWDAVFGVPVRRAFWPSFCMEWLKWRPRPTPAPSWTSFSGSKALNPLFLAKIWKFSQILPSNTTERALHPRFVIAGQWHSHCQCRCASHLRRTWIIGTGGLFLRHGGAAPAHNQKQGWRVEVFFFLRFCRLWRKHAYQNHRREAIQILADFSASRCFDSCWTSSGSWSQDPILRYPKHIFQRIRRIESNKMRIWTIRIPKISVRKLPTGTGCIDFYPPGNDHIKVPTGRGYGTVPCRFLEFIIIFFQISCCWLGEWKLK